MATIVKQDPPPFANLSIGTAHVCSMHNDLPELSTGTSMSSPLMSMLKAGRLREWKVPCVLQASHEKWTGTDEGYVLFSHNMLLLCSGLEEKKVVWIGGGGVLYSNRAEGAVSLERAVTVVLSKEKDDLFTFAAWQHIDKLIIWHNLWRYILGYLQEEASGEKREARLKTSGQAFVLILNAESGHPTHGHYKALSDLGRSLK